MSRGFQEVIPLKAFSRLRNSSFSRPDVCFSPMAQQLARAALKSEEEEEEEVEEEEDEEEEA